MLFLFKIKRGREREELVLVVNFQKLDGTNIIYMRLLAIFKNDCISRFTVSEN